MKKFKFLLSLFALAALPAAANAQTANARVTTTPPSYINGQVSPLSLDVDGNLRMICISGCAGGGGTQDVNIAELGGVAWAGAMPVSGPLTDAQLRAVAVPVSGPLTDAQLRAVAVPVSGPLTDAQLRAVAVPVSGPLTDAQLRAAVVPVQDSANGATAAAVPARAIYAGANSNGVLTGIIQASASARISVSTATTTEIVALNGSQKIYVTSFDVIASGTGGFKFVYGTGTNCGTGTTNMTGNYGLAAQAGIAKGSGLGPVLIVPAGNALCVTTDAAVQMSGSVAYTQF